MKNFKRVISAVIAMALSVSSFVAVSANKFSDVAETASYAEAIDVLTALKIVNGYEDGTFKPEGEITRAEAATMIVGALNMVEDAKNAAGTSQFADVNEKASWATGYINVGVSQGFISGMGDGTFAPQNNVTYAQMCVMLTKITGYGEYAAQDGGYPSGYTKMAVTAGINKGVAAANEANLTRGQVAQMIYNTLCAPMLGVTKYKFDGNEYSKLDGVSTYEFKSLLSDKFNGFEFKGIVADLTAKAGEVKFGKVTTDYSTATPVKDKIFTTADNSDAIIDNGIDLTNSFKQEVRGIIIVDNNDKRHLIYAKATEAYETISYTADQYTSTEFDKADKTTIKFDGVNTTMEPIVEIFVNGAAYTTVKSSSKDSDDNNKVLDDILTSAVGTIKLAKLDSTSNNYDAIFVESYIIGQVTSVSYKSGVATIKFTPADNNMKDFNTIKIADNDIDNGSVKVSVKLGDEEIKLQDLEEDDVIAIKTDLTTGSTKEINSANKDITILVSRDTTSGKLTTKETGKGENSFIIDGTDYAAVDKSGFDMQVGKTYNVIYLDPFGRLFAYSEESIVDSTKYAILAKVEDDEVTLVLPDGTRKVYEAKDKSKLSGLKSVYADVTASDYAKVLDCVVEYTVKTATGEIQTIKNVAGVPFNGGKDGEYKESVGKVGVVGLTDSTNVVSLNNVAYANSYKDYKSMSKNDFVDGTTYLGAGFGKITGTTNYSFVIVTSAGKTYNATSRFAVVDAEDFSVGVNEDGDEINQLKVLYNGEKTKLDFSIGLVGTNNSKTVVGPRGTAFFFDTDSDGYVSAVTPITMTTIKAGGSLSAPFASGAYDADDWGFTLAAADSNKDIKLVKGLVVGTTSSSIRLVAAPTADGLFDADDFESYALSDDCVVYTFDENEELEDNERLDESGVVLSESFKDWQAKNAANPADNGKVYWTTSAAVEGTLTAAGVDAKKAANLAGTKTSDDAQYALVLVVDDQAVEIYEILHN